LKKFKRKKAGLSIVFKPGPAQQVDPRPGQHGAGTVPGLKKIRKGKTQGDSAG